MPDLTPAQKKKRYNIAIKGAYVAPLVELARDEGRSLTNTVNTIIGRYLRDKGRLTPNTQMSDWVHLPTEARRETMSKKEEAE